MGSQVVKVKRDTLEACMTCPLCHKLLREATTISLCLHTFCRKCIYEKLSDEEMESCPICNIDLGCLPVEKLRPDHNLQDIRARIFPFKRRKVEAQELAPSISFPAKRKERSLSSLVVSAPKVSMQKSSFTGRRTKTGTRKVQRACSFAVKQTIKKEAPDVEDDPGSSMAEPSKKQRPNGGTSNKVELAQGKIDLWTPLNSLVEAANRTKSSKSSPQGISLAKLESPTTPHEGLYTPESAAGLEPPAAVQSDLHVPKTNKDNSNKTKFDDKKEGNISPLGPVKRRKLRPAGQKRAAPSAMSASAQVVLDANGGKSNMKNSPIWFSLVASEDQKGTVPLPQITACYLRIKDGTVPVAIIQKYLVKKLNLSTEAEVEIMCRGEPLLPSLQLHNLADLWFRTASASKKIPASVGSSAKDFVMVLSYSRKALPP